MTRLTIIEKPNEIVYWDIAQLPPGSMWRDSEHDLPDRDCWVIILPNRAGPWRTTERAGGTGNLWDVTGTPPDITVKPSINAEVQFTDGRVEGWHGFITNGEFSP